MEDAVLLVDRISKLGLEIQDRSPDLALSFSDGPTDRLSLASSPSTPRVQLLAVDPISPNDSPA